MGHLVLGQNDQTRMKKEAAAVAAQRQHSTFHTDTHTHIERAGLLKSGEI